MAKLSTLLSLAGTGLLATAAFVRPPVSPSKASAPTQTVAAPKAKSAIVSTAKPAPFAVAPQASKRALMVDIVAFAGWGSAVGELGREMPQEASPEAPMSLVVDDLGAVHVLDQVNERISIFDGKNPVRVVPIPTRTAQDLALDPRGGYALLDRLVERALIFVDAAGKERSRVQITGQGVAESGEVTALFAATDGYWVEVEHKTLVRIADLGGMPDSTRPMLEGRMTKSGDLLRAARDPAGFAVVSAIGPNGFFARVPFSAGVLSLVDLAADDGGTTWVAAHVGDENGSFQLVNEAITLVAIDRTGLEIGRVDLPPPEGPEEQLRAMTISPAGAVHHLHVANVGATIRRVK